MVRIKDRAVKRCEKAIRAVYIEEIAKGIKMLNREESLTLFTKNEFKIMSDTNGSLDFHDLSI